MSRSVYKPEPPAPVESVSLFGCHDGVRRLVTIGAYFGCCMLTVRSCSGCSLLQLIMLHAWWWLCACYLAREINGFVCELINEDAQRAYAKALMDAMISRPIRHLERSRETGELEPVYAPFRERPLIDPEMGVRERV